MRKGEKTAVVRSFAAVATVLAACALAAPAPAVSQENVAGGGQPAARAETSELDAIARNLVHESAGIREGDIVLISGSPRDLQLLEDLAVHARMLGAYPLVTLESDRMARRMYDDVPAKFDTQEPKLAMKLAELADVFISVDSNEDPQILAHAAPERLAARGRTFIPVSQLIQKRNIRRVNVGNGMYPTSANAELYGMPEEELERMFWEGVSVDYGALKASGDAVRTVFSGGKELRITNPNGTDLKMRIEGRPVFVSDGQISADEVQRGGAATEVWLPAGEVYLTPVPRTAEGKVVVERDVFQGKEIQGITYTVKGGKVTDLSARSGIEPFKAFYDAAGPGKDDFAYVDIGLNPSVRVTPGSKFQNFVPAGMVTVGFGGNTWAGGENTVPFGTAHYLPGSTVTVDGKVIVDKGTLKM